MESIEIIYALKDEIEAKYNELGLLSLKAMKMDEKDSLVYCSDVFRSRQSLKELPVSDFQYFDELTFLSEDLIYITSLLHILKDNITDTSRGSYKQTWEDHLYLRYANFGFQTIYNFWDRLGDILHLFFYTGLPDDQVYFTRVMNNFPPANRSPVYDELKSLYTGKVETLLQVRHNVVHHFGLKTHHVWGYLDSYSDQEKRERLNEEKASYATLFLEQVFLLFEGFRLTLSLIEELPEKS